MKYKRVTADNRKRIALWKREGKTNQEIAEQLAVSPATIRREIRRNSNHGVYDPEKADSLAKGMF